MALPRGRQDATAGRSGRWPLAIVLLLIVVTSLGVDDAIGHGAVTLLAGGAGALSAAIAASRIRRRSLRLVMAALAGSIAAVVLATWHMGVPAGGATLGQLGAGLRASLIAVWAGVPPGELGLSLGLAVLAWANGYAAAAGLLEKQRLRDCLVLLGIPLVVALLFARSPDIGWLVLFTAGAMLLNLWVVEHRRGASWRRRTLSLEGDVSVRIRRAGTLATLAVVALAWLLATVAVSAPLSGMLRDAESFIRNTTSGIGSWPGAGPNVGAPDFADSFRIGEEWNPTDEPVLEVRGDLGQAYLRAITYDRFTGTGWSQALAPPRQVPANGLLSRDPSLELGTGWRESETQWRITAAQSFDALILPIGASSVSRTVQLEETAGAHFVAIVRSPVKAGDTYVVTGSGAEAPDLTATVAAYPPGLPDSYLATDGASEATIRLARQVAGVGTPYERASRLAGYLQGAGFSYQERVSIPAGENVVDWLLFDPTGHVGFCEQYATAMVVMARAAGIPARLARGYAGGVKQPDGSLLFRAADGHMWAELYFPGHGWQVFEATPGRRGPDRRIAGGIGTPTQSAAPTLTQHSQREITEGSDPSAQPRSGQQLPAAAVIGLMVALILGAAVVVAGVQRSRRAASVLTPMQVWQRLTVAGERAGIPRRASQTPYEYAAMLQEHVPNRSGEIASIAIAVVVAAYAPTGYRASAQARDWAGLKRALARLELRRRLSGLRGHRDG